MVSSLAIAQQPEADTAADFDAIVIVPAFSAFTSSTAAPAEITP
jgi:hypothetical protein